MIILVFLLFLLFLVTYNNENFTYFNLNFNLNNPVSNNVNEDTYYKINLPTSDYDLNNNIEGNIFNNRIKLLNINNTPNENLIKPTNLIDSKNCCLVQKDFDSGEFNYKYKLLKDDECSINLYELDQNNKLLFDGINRWSNDMCNSNSSKLGSCRLTNRECLDFMTKEDCFNITSEAKADFYLKFDLTNQNNKFNSKMVWSKKTCNERIN
jgi:hypothetical protein